MKKIIPPLKCKECASTHVINTFDSHRCYNCGLINGLGKSRDYRVKLEVRDWSNGISHKPFLRSYFDLDDEEDGERPERYLMTSKNRF